MPSASGGSGPMSWKACEPAWRRGWLCTISVSGSTSNLVVLGWLSLICWSGDLNSHQAFKAQGIGGAESSKERGVGFSGRYAALKDNRGATMGILSLPILVAWYVAPQSTERSNTCRT